MRRETSGRAARFLSHTQELMTMRHVPIIVSSAAAALLSRCSPQGGGDAPVAKAQDAVSAPAGQTSAAPMGSLQAAI